MKWTVLGLLGSGVCYASFGDLRMSVNEGNPPNIHPHKPLRMGEYEAVYPGPNTSHQQKVTPQRFSKRLQHKRQQRASGTCRRVGL